MGSFEKLFKSKSIDFPGLAENDHQEISGNLSFSKTNNVHHFENTFNEKEHYLVTDRPSSHYYKLGDTIYESPEEESKTPRMLKLICDTKEGQGN